VTARPRAPVPLPSTAEDSEDALAREITLSELVSRVLDRGVVISGEVVISVAGIDLVYLGLRAVLSSVETLRATAGEPSREDT
jgi:hypothetical protein